MSPFKTSQSRCGELLNSFGRGLKLEYRKFGLLNVGEKKVRGACNTPPSCTCYLVANHHNTPMAGGKKKKKPASNPARGFTTTSIASKPKAELQELVADTAPLNEPKETDEPQQIEKTAQAVSSLVPDGKVLTAEEFEKQLEESELQVLVEKYAQKSKRDAIRQKTRLETDRRLLRSQAENLNTRKWLPPELMEEILDLVKAEGRFTGQSGEVFGNSKQVPEEELTIRLWTLQQALLGSSFTEERVNLALRHVLDISDKIGLGNKDAIWGLEEALDWLARNSSREELPDYENWQRRIGGLPRSQSGWSIQDPLCFVN
jgi:ATP-dependent RNA helicase DHX29